MATVTGRLFCWEIKMSYKFVLISDEYIEYLRKNRFIITFRIKNHESIYHRKEV